MWGWLIPPSYFSEYTGGFRMGGLIELSDHNPTGTRLGQDTTDKISFYGATAVDRPETVGDATAVATSVAVSTTDNWGYTSSTQANAIVTLVNALKTDLEAIGLLG